MKENILKLYRLKRPIELGLEDFYFLNLDEESLNLLDSCRELQSYNNQTTLPLTLVPVLSEIFDHQSVLDLCTKYSREMYDFLYDICELRRSGINIKDIRFPDQFLDSVKTLKSSPLSPVTELYKYSELYSSIVLNKESSLKFIFHTLDLKQLSNSAFAKSDELKNFITESLNSGIVYVPFTGVTTQFYNSICKNFGSSLDRSVVNLYFYLKELKENCIDECISNIDPVVYNNYSDLTFIDLEINLEDEEFYQKYLDEVTRKMISLKEEATNKKLQEFYSRLDIIQDVSPQFFKRSKLIENNLVGNLNDFRFLLGLSSKKGYSDIQSRLQVCNLEVSIDSDKGEIKLKLPNDIINKYFK